MSDISKIPPDVLEALQEVIKQYEGEKKILGNAITQVRMKGILSGCSDRSILQWSDDTYGTDFMSRVYWEHYN